VPTSIWDFLKKASRIKGFRDFENPIFRPKVPSKTKNPKKLKTIDRLSIHLPCLPFSGNLENPASSLKQTPVKVVKKQLFYMLTQDKSHLRKTTY
jgi:hypothetical protein